MSSLRKELVYGFKPLGEALLAGSVEKIWVRADKLDRVKALVAELVNGRPLPISVAPAEFFPEKEWVAFLPAEISYLGYDDIQNIGDLVVVVDGVTDAGNLGAIFRSAVAFGAKDVLLDLHNTGSVTPRVVEISRGAALQCRMWRLNIKRVIPKLSEMGFAIVGLEAHEGRPIFEVDLKQPVALVVGSESSGMRPTVKKLCTVLANIPTTFESLNVHVALSVALYECRRQRTSSSGSKFS
ncbi:RNA methyltransferase [Coprothermobacteraceae bacterium]|nr:RNA methyltransferase [Coprothermobacteraceae bacterium]